MKKSSVKCIPHKKEERTVRRQAELSGTFYRTMKKMYYRDWILLTAFGAALTAVMLVVLKQVLDSDPLGGVRSLLILSAAAALALCWFLFIQIMVYLKKKASIAYQDEEEVLHEEAK